MATMLIAEYAHLTHDTQGHVVPLPENPPVAEQAVTFSTTASFISSALSTATRIVRVHCSAIGHLNFGTSTISSTTSNATKLAASTPEYFGVLPGTYIAVTQGS